MDSHAALVVILNQWLETVSASVHVTEHHGVRVWCVTQFFHGLQRIGEKQGTGHDGSGPCEDGAIGVAGGTIRLLPHYVAPPLGTRVLKPNLIGKGIS